MRLFLGLLLLLKGSVVLAGEPLPRVIDIKPYAKSLAIYHDGKGHYFVLHQELKDSTSVRERFFYGDGKRFFKQLIPSSGRNGEDAYFSVLEPRVAGGAYSLFERKKGKVGFLCETRNTPLTRLDAKQTEAMLKSATFYGIYFARKPYVLARDENGRYFYVDRVLYDGADAMTAFRSGDFRVYAGMRGKMKALRMKNVVSDASGEIFITPDGRLRLIVDKTEGNGRTSAQWIAAGKKTSLTLVPLESFRTVMMIFRDLGPYIGQRLERPCDDL